MKNPWSRAHTLVGCGNSQLVDQRYLEHLQNGDEHQLVPAGYRYARWPARSGFPTPGIVTRSGHLWRLAKNVVDALNALAKLLPGDSQTPGLLLGSVMSIYRISSNQRWGNKALSTWPLNSVSAHAIAAGFTTGELAVLKVVGDEWLHSHRRLSSEPE